MEGDPDIYINEAFLVAIRVSLCLFFPKKDRNKTLDLPLLRIRLNSLIAPSHPLFVDLWSAVCVISLSDFWWFLPWTMCGPRNWKNYIHHFSTLFITKSYPNKKLCCFVPHPPLSPLRGGAKTAKGQNWLLLLFAASLRNSLRVIRQVAIKEALSLEVLRSPQTSDVVAAKPISKDSLDWYIIIYYLHKCA